MKYKNQDIVKLINSNIFYQIIDSEIVLGIKIYYLSNKISVAEHQIERICSNSEISEYSINKVKDKLKNGLDPDKWASNIHSYFNSVLK
jgi:hypothetical protein